MSFEYRAVPLEVVHELPEKAQSDTSSITLEGEDDYESDAKNALHKSFTPLTQRAPPRVLWILQGILFSLSIALFILSHINFTSTLEYVRTYSAWSPAANAVQYSTVRYNISTSGNPFVGKGPAIDKAWRGISYDMGDQWISKEDMKRLGMPEWHLKVDNPATGESGYRVGIESFHQLHCLNLLRQVTYRDYYEPLGGPFARGADALKAHTGKSGLAGLSNHAK